MNPGSSNRPLDDWIALAANQVASARRGAEQFRPISPTARLGPPAIPGYQILSEHARGGQGVVYEAMQLGTQRRVAIKVLRGAAPGDASATAARFEREVELLAQLRHPNIVAIHESSLAGDSCYCVMEFVDGAPLDRWLAARATDRLWSIESTLALFTKIADAVQAAHVRGVIHRDLKPGNVMIDQLGEPRVLDFGLAKLQGANGAEHLSQMTQTGQFVGSLPWSSPEQLEGRQTEIDTRSDVYSLGVMLYNALTGHMPHPLGAALPEFIRQVREVEPRDPRSLQRGVDDELSTIVLKCLQKEPARRYQTAGELAADLRHYLANEPISAKRDSQVYLLRKMLHRHRWPVRAAAGAALLLLATAGALAWMYVDQARARQQADAAREAAEAARETAIAANREAARRAAQAEASLDFLRDQVLGAVDPARVSGPVTLEAMLADATEAIEEGALTHEPLVEASVREALGSAYINLADYDSAEKQYSAALALRQATDPGDEIALRSAFSGLGEVLEGRGDYDGAIRQFTAALELARRAGAETGEAVARQLSNIGVMYRGKGDYARAEEYFRASLAARESQSKASGEYAGTLASLGGSLFDRGDIAGGTESFEQAIAIDRAAGAAREFGLASTLVSFGGYLTNQTREYEKARAVLEEAIEIYQRHVGPEHRYLLTAQQNLATVLTRLGRRPEAEALLRECVRLRRIQSPRHMELRGALHNLGWFLGETGRYAEAVPIMEESLAIGEELQGRNHPACQSTVDALGYYMVRVGRWTDAIALLCEQHCRQLSETDFDLPIDPSDDAARKTRLSLAQTAGLLGRAFVENGDPASGESLIRDCLEIRSALLPAQDTSVISARWMLADCLARARRRMDALAIADATVPLIAGEGPAQADFRAKFCWLVEQLER
ncbi:MAG: serine/threonine-protein kinase [Phycisphaerae bacterium]|nr:serine/threonine-protein kinase [Phycisphaerae bacterium]